MANTTSGTTTFDKTFSIDEIIEDAFEGIGLQAVGKRHAHGLSKRRFGEEDLQPRTASRF